MGRENNSSLKGNMGNKKAVSFYSDIYRQRYYFLRGWSRELVEKTLSRQTGTAAGLTHSKDGAIYIWIEKIDYESIGDLAHECVHACSFTFSNVGIEVSVDNDEVQAYLTGWIFDLCFRSLRRSLKK